MRKPYDAGRDIAILLSPFAMALIIAVLIEGCADTGEGIFADSPCVSQDATSTIMQCEVRRNPQLLWKYQEVMEDGVIMKLEEEEFNKLVVKKSADKFITEQLQRAVDAGESGPEIRIIRPTTVRLMTPEEVEAARRGE